MHGGEFFDYSRNINDSSNVKSHNRLFPKGQISGQKMKIIFLAILSETV